MIYNNLENVDKNISTLKIAAFSTIYGNVPLYVKGNIILPVHHIINEIYYKNISFGKICVDKYNLNICDILEIISYYRNNSMIIYDKILQDNIDHGFRTNGWKDPDEIPDWIIRMI